MPRLHVLAVSAAALLLLAISLSAAGAQESQVQRQIPTSPAQLQLSFAPIVKRVAPAVVNVYAARVIENSNPFLADPFFRQFFGVVPRQQVERSLGSGVIVDPSGLVVTNYHVIEGASEVKVALSDKREFPADIVLKDQRSDLAVLRIKGAKERFPTLQFANSDEAQVGDVVLAIGDPFGVGQTVTHGIVSAVARTDVGVSDYQFFIQTDAAINPGNSGGPLVDMNGRMVGLNSAIYSRSGGSQGIGFAIPANMVRIVVASAEGGSGAVKRAWLGAKLQEVTPDIADSLGLQRPSGALVANVAADSPAGHAGIKTGDVIVSVDGTAVDDPTAFNYRFATKPLGGTAQLGVIRQGHAIVVPVTLQSLPGHAARGGRDPHPARHSAAPRWQIFRRLWPTRCGLIRTLKGWWSPTWPTVRRRSRSAFRRATSSFPSTIRRSTNPPTLSMSPAPAAGNGGSR